MPGNAFQLARDSDFSKADALQGALQSPKALIRDILDGKDTGGAIEEVTRRLGRPDYTIVDLLDDVKHIKAEIAATQCSTAVLVDRWTLLDQVVEKCIFAGMLGTAGAEQRTPQSGPSFEPIEYLRARQKIGDVVATMSDYQALYGSIVAIVRGFIEFDWANLFIYSPKRDYSRIICTRGPEIAFVSRWFSTPNGYIDWLEGPNTWMTDLEEVLCQTAPEYLERTDTKAAIEAGMKALVCLPIRSGGHIIGGFCLASKQKSIYDAGSRQILEQLNLEQAFLPLINIVEAAERDFANGLIKQIASSESMQEVAEKVVHALARFYEYQNVSIFKANLLRNRLQLLAQSPVPTGRTALPTGYSQGIDEGLLGLCFKRRDCIILKDRDDGSEEAKAYIAVAPEIRSELCIPIRLFQRVLWILNLEDCLGDAFTRIEVDKLQDVIRQMQATLERIFQGMILMKVLDVCPAAIMVTDQRHNILRCNRQARQMMEQDSASTDDNLDDFFDVSPDTFATEPTASMFLGNKGRGKATQVLAHKYTLEEEYDHLVFLVLRVADIEWTAKFETLRAALAETTAQVRVPVSLLSSFVQRIDHRTTEDDIRDIARKATRQLGRIELTYDRVLAAYAAQTLPAKRRTKVEIKRVLDFILSDLPELERKSIRVSVTAPGEITVDAFRLIFALNSMLAYLLRSRAGDTTIVIAARRRSKTVEISMTGAIPKSRKTRHLAAMVEAVRSEIALGEDVLVRIATEAGGDFAHVRQKNGGERLSLRLAA